MASASGPERKKTKPWKQEINHPIVEPSLISSDMIEIDGSILEGVGYTVCMHVCMLLLLLLLLFLLLLLLLLFHRVVRYCVILSHSAVYWVNQFILQRYELKGVIQGYAPSTSMEYGYV